MRALNRLSASFVKSPRPGQHHDGGGLYLSIRERDGHVYRSWLFRWRDPAGREHLNGLGSLNVIGLATARQKAAELRAQIGRGDFPSPRRKRTSGLPIENLLLKNMTFDECAKRYGADKRAGWRTARHAKSWQSMITRYASPRIGRVPVGEITMMMVKEVLIPIWTAKPVTANRVRVRIEAVLDWAAAHQLRSGDNPARWRGHLANVLPAIGKVHTQKHLPAMPYAQIGVFVAKLRQQHGADAAALELAILTAARTKEVLLATWNEIDLESEVWTVPADRMKMEKPHRVPLSPPALAILKRMAAKRENEFVFPGKIRPWLRHSALLDLLNRLLGNTDITVHGFRSSFRDWASEQTSFPPELAEAAIAHQRGNAAERAYARSDLFDKRRRLMDAWAEYCEQTSAAGEIVPLRRPIPA